MSAIGTATSYASDISSLLLSSSSDTSTTAGPPTAAPPTASAPASDSNDRGPATSLQLSDKVKSILAQASSDAVVAERLQAFVQSRHTGGGSSDGSSDGSSTSQSATIDVNQSFAELSGNAGSSGASDIDQPVQVVKSFDTGLKADGYTISAMASGIDGSSRIIIFGTNGFNFLDEHFGSEDEASNGQAAPGTTFSEVQRGNVEYVTINQASAAATSVQTSSAAGSTSASSIASQSSTVTIAVDFSTGAVSLTQAVATSVATTAQITQPSPSFSTLA